MKIPQKKNFYTSNKDRVFHFEEMIDWEKLSQVHEVDKEVLEMVFETAGKVSGEKMALRAPQNNRERYSIENDDLVWPDGIKESYNDLLDTGLICTSVSEKYGGPGLPGLITAMIGEMMFQADPGFAVTPLLQSGVAEMIEFFGSEKLKSEYLPKLTSGEFTGSMDLTEPDAGSDLGGIRTKATEIDGKTYVAGTKTFISNGGADVHLVLVRENEDYSETKGTTKGLSIYLVPKKIDNESNNVKVTNLEEKLGIHSSPTCEVVFDESADGKGCVGFLVGEKGQGLKQMFKLMNNARLGVAAQALGTLEAAIDDAKQYAIERKQFGKEIAKQSIVKEMLTDMQITSEVIRSIVYTASFAVDMEHGLKKKLETTEDDAEKAVLKADIKKYSNQARLLTPLIKYYAAEKAIELTRTGIQIHGGVGYTTEYNAERYLRDSVITAIYEGTSEIQASLFLNDSIEGNMRGENAKVNLSWLIDDVNQGLSVVEDPELKKLAGKVRQATGKLKKSLQYISNHTTATWHPIERPRGDVDTVLTQAKNLVEMTAEVYGAYQLLLQATKNDRKKTVAKLFIQDMVHRVKMYSSKIKNMSPELNEDRDKVLELDYQE